MKTKANTKINHKGQRFGRLVVVDEGPRLSGDMSWFCLCDCGNLRNIRGRSLRNGDTKSCGCIVSENAIKRNYKHGYAVRGPNLPIYRTWLAMMHRCYESQATNYKYYGGLGVTVCERWHHFPNFLEDTGPRPEGKSLDRIDTYGNYQPGNCRWATPKQQAANQRGK